MDKRTTNKKIIHCVANGYLSCAVVIHSPVKATLEILNPISKSGVTTPSTVPNIDPRPRDKSMVKKRTDHTGLPGMLIIASVNTMKANPVP